MRKRLAHQAKLIDSEAIVVHRLKRLVSIKEKLVRFKHRPEMLNLSTMQDIAGCRAILRDADSVRALVETMKVSTKACQYVREDDYIRAPKRGGYRSHHLIYQYQTTSQRSPHNGMSVEIQIRSRLQHLWATAEESVGVRIGHSLKTGNGPPEWKRLFVLMGTVIALTERQAIIPGTPSDPDTIAAELSGLVSRLNALDVLEQAGQDLAILAVLPDKEDFWFLLLMDFEERSTSYEGFPINQQEEANARFLELEREMGSNPKKQVALVSAASVAELRTAYPNFVGDTRAFADEVRRALAPFLAARPLP